MNTEDKLKILFDYQLFENNNALKCVIDESCICREELSDDDLAAISAAGSVPAVAEIITHELLD